MKKNRVDPAVAARLAAQYPQAYEHLKTHDFYVPDALKDNGNRRSSRSVSVLEKIERLKQVSACPAVVHGEFDLSQLNGSPLYSKKTIERAKKIIENHFKATGVEAFIWKLERGRNGGMHAHVLLPASEDLTGLTACDLLSSAKDEQEIAKYLCKPADARACGAKPQDLRVWTADEFDDHLMAAIEEQVRARNASADRYHYLHAKGLKKGL